MSLFDLRTAYIVMGFLYLLMPAIVLIALRGSRSDAAVAWCSGGFMLGCGVFVIATRGIAPEWFSLGAGNALVIAGLALRVGAVRRELELPIRAFAVTVLAAVAVVVYETFRAIDVELKVASTWVSFVQGCLAAYLAFLAGHLASRERSIHVISMSVSYGLLALSLFVRVAGLVQGWGNSNVWRNPTPTADLLFLSLSGILVAVVSNVGYLAFYFERAKRAEVAGAAAKAAREASTRFAAQVADLERHRSLGLVAMSLSHELTQPLSAIAVQARVARQAGDQSGALDRIVESVMRAGSIVERIRGFIRPVAARPEPVELVSLAREVADLFEDQARGAGVDLKLPAAGEAAWVSGDRISLCQIILNAYRNALDASAPLRGSEIRVAVESRGERCRLLVRDFGAGLSEAAQRQAGEPLFTTKPGGLGVGLAVSRALAEQHGGSINLRNAPGGGAVFELSLPALVGSAKP